MTVDFVELHVVLSVLRVSVALDRSKTLRCARWPCELGPRGTWLDPLVSLSLSSASLLPCTLLSASTSHWFQTVASSRVQRARALNWHLVKSARGGGRPSRAAVAMRWGSCTCALSGTSVSRRPRAPCQTAQCQTDAAPHAGGTRPSPAVDCCGTADAAGTVHSRR